MRAQLDELWLHSVRLAAISRVLAKKLTRINPDQAMLGGLLHDIGKIYILTRAEQYPALFGDATTFTKLIKEWHTGVGAAILDRWNFDKMVVMAADEHEILDREITTTTDLVDVVMLANLFANHDQQADQPPNWDGIPAMARLRLTSTAVLELLAESNDQFESIVEAMTS